MILKERNRSHNMEDLHFYIRHHPDFIHEKMVLVFKNEKTKEFFEKKLPGATFEKITAREAENAVRIGIGGKVLPYAYTIKLTDEEMKQLSTANWERTARLLAEGNERLYQELLAKEQNEQ